MMIESGGAWWVGLYPPLSILGFYLDGGNEIER